VFVGATCLVSVLSVFLLGCQREDLSWRARVEAGPLAGYGDFNVEKGKFGTFADCERAMMTDVGDRVDRDILHPPKGYTYRPIFHYCEQGSSQYLIGITYNLLLTNPK
jgi:hypothetical protein